MHKASVVPEFRPVAAPSLRGVIQEELNEFGLSAIYTITQEDCDILCHDYFLNRYQSLSMYSMHLPP